MAAPSKQLVEAVFKALWAANLSNYPREYIENLSISLATELANLSGGGGGSGLANIVEDLTPQLGGTLDANGNNIDMGTNLITDTKVGQWDTAYSWGDHSTEGYLTSETDSQTLSFSSPNLSISNGNSVDLSALSSGISGISNVVEDTTPQLGGNLDINSNDITGTGNIDITGSVTVSGEFLGDLDGAVFVRVYNNTASTINKGAAVYLTGGNNGDKPHIDLADSSDANKMPALGIVKENINPSSEGQVAVSGKINFSSHGFTAGANLYINGLGALQETAPTGEGNLIQKIGKVVSPNIILVQGAFRSNATPNLNNGKIFLGNGSNQAVSTILDTSVVPENTNLYYTSSRFNSAFNSKSTSNLSEGTNLYYTNARVQAISINNVVEDTSPQLGGNLDVNRNDITGNPAIDGRRAIVEINDTDRTLSLDEAGDFIIVTNNGAPTTITIPTNESVEFTTGTEIDFIQKTAQVLTIQAASGVTLNGVDSGSTSITAQWGGATIKKIDTNEWIIVGKINDVG